MAAPVSLPAGLFVLSGSDRRTVLNSLVTNDVKSLAKGQAVMACLLTPKGKVVTSLLILEQGENFLLVTPPQTAGAFAGGLAKYLSVSESALEDLSESMHAVFSPEGGPDFFPVPKEFWGQAGGVTVATGKGPAVFPEGWETCRIEAGAPTLGVDAGEDVYPTELGWDFLLNETKGCYVGQETTARLRFKGQARRKLARLKLSAPAKAGAALVWQGSEAGRLTSVTPDGRAGLSLLAREAAVPGQRLELRGGPEGVTAEVLP